MTDKQRDQIVDLARRGRSLRSIAKEYGTSFGVIKRIVAASGGVTKGDRVTVASAGDVERITIASPRQIRTLDDAIAFANVDTSVWRVKSWECTGWEVGMKVRTFGEKGTVVEETPITRPLWRVALKLERIAPQPVVDAVTLLVERFRSGVPPRPPTFQNWNARGHLCVVDLVDAHFGKLAWAAETGQNYDLKIAERLFRDAIAEILEKSAGYKVSEFLFQIGSDAIHVDNYLNTTTAGTPQDVDGRMSKILDTAIAAYVWAIEEMAAVAPVRGYWIPGNHDRLMSLLLARVIDARFHGDPAVTIDCSPSPRKYHRWGRVLIGMTHGNEEKHADLPLVMASERPKDWAECAVREFHIGHHHRSKSIELVTSDTRGPMLIRWLRSLSAADAWHHRKGYVGVARAAEAYFYHEDALVGAFVAPVREAFIQAGN